MNRREFNIRLATAAAAPILEPYLLRSQSEARINGERLNRHLKELSEFGKNPVGGVNRIAYSEADRQARNYAVGLMRAARLDTSIDAAGNIVGRRAGRDPKLAPLLIGSHIDSVPDGGNYDGDVGSLSAIEVAQTLAEKSIITRHPLEVIIFENEEGGLIGSLALIGDLTDKELAEVSRSGKTFREGIRFIGGDPSRLESVRLKRGDIAAYLELHIEQGGILEGEKVDIGVVEGIVGIRWWDVTVEGIANHAGTTPMNQRHDALLAGARFIQAVNRIVTGMPGRQVGTIGRIQAFPGAPNVIPGKVTLSLELRDLDAQKIEVLFQQVYAEAKRIGDENGTSFDFHETSVNVPAPSDERVRRFILESAQELGLRSRLMPSGAGHDAQDMARLAPMGMIFVPSVGGISHSPKEYTRPEDIVNGANVLLGTLLKLDAAPWL